MPDNNPAPCPCMREPSWDNHVAVFGSNIGRIVRDQIDGSGACQKGVRELLAAAIVASIVAAEGSATDTVVDAVFSKVKEITNK